MPARLWIVRAKVVRWIDGDTLVADLDLGWHVWRAGARVRLLGYDAPELGEPEGPAWKEAAENVCPVGSEVSVASHRLDGFGRVLANVNFDGIDVARAIRESAGG